MSKSNIFKIAGDMTIYEAEEIKTLFSQATESSADVFIDLGNVSEIDSCGIQLMIALKKSLKEKDLNVFFESHTDAVIEIFDVFDVSTYFGDPIVLDKKAE